MLFAALIVPWFVNWDSYKANFEREATRILGHPVHVGGAAHVTILPSPSLTFSDVEVGEPGALPIMSIERFSATMELVPLMQGQFRIVSMKLESPTVRISVDDAGAINWMQRTAPATQKLDADKVVLSGVQITDGTLSYTDARTGVALAFGEINANVAADSLAGPWRADGGYRQGERVVPFRFATGRQLENGNIRLQSQFSPAEVPAAVSLDGVLANTPDSGLAYAGTYTLAEAGAPAATQAKDASEDTAPVNAGWRSEGTFALSRDRIAIDKAVLSTGPVERPTSIAGSLSLNFGKNPSFTASGEARQLDLDSSLGGGPDKPVNVAEAATGFVQWLANLPAPPIPGHIAFNVPGIVVGGSVIQDVAFAAEPAAGGWKIQGLRARLPGQAIVEADGELTTDRQVGFTGSARLAVAQPATFAAWWRGGSQAGSGRLLSAFDISGNAEIGPGRVSVDKVDAQVGGATITGRFDWGEVKGKRRELSTDLKADRIDFAQVKALADLLIGRDLTDAAALADSFSIRLAADAFQYEDINMKGVAVDAAYAGDVLNVVQLAIADIGGTSFRVTSGRIDGLTGNPRGHLDAKLEVSTFDGLTVIAGKLAPGSGIAEWLARTAPALAPAVLNAKVTAPPKNGAGFQIALEGVAGPTTFTGTLQSAVSLNAAASWRDAPATFSAALDSPDSAGLAQQFGFAAATADNDSGAHVSVKGAGVPKDGLDTAIETEFAGLTSKAQGRLAFAANASPAFTGSFSLTADDIASFVATAGTAVPGAAAGTPISITGTIVTNGPEGSLNWKGGTVADRSVDGAVKIARTVDPGWRLDGDLAIDAVDLGWLASLSLGFAPEIGDDPKTPWSKATFAPPTYGNVSGKLNVATQHLSIGELDVAGGKLALTLAPDRVDADLKDGHLAGGAASGGVSIQNVDGSANVSGQFNMTGATLDQFVWQADGAAIVTGGLDLSANFEATGRSPAALVSSMTGGGVIGIHNGVAHGVNPETAAAIVRVSDLGDPLSDDVLRSAIEQQMAADALSFGESGGAFSIAGGTARITGLIARGANLEADGSAVVDLNALTLDSDWTLTFSGADTIPNTDQPKIGVAFRGPLSAPERTIDPLPFNSYLSTRQAARMLDVIATEEADHAERERLTQQIAKIRNDAARAERLRLEAIAAEKRRAQAEADAIVRIANAHVDREIDADERAAAALVRTAELAAAAREKAEVAAATAAASAAAARTKADQASLAVAGAIRADADAGAEAAQATANLRGAQSAATSTAKAASAADVKAVAAEQKAAAAIKAETRATTTADRAAAAASTAAQALDAANAAAATTGAAATTAADERAQAQTALDAAGKILGDAFRARDAATTAAAAADAALAKAQAGADDAAESARSSAQAATGADAERARLQMLAEAALNDQRAAEAAKDTARTALDAAKADYMSKLGAVAQVQRDNPGGNDVASVGKRAAADHAHQNLEIATKDYEAAEQKAAAAASATGMAQAAADEAVARAAAAATAAAAAAEADDAVKAALAEKLAARDDTAKRAAEAQAAAQQAGSNFNAAQSAASAAADRAAKAQRDADAAANAQSAAMQASANSGPSGAVFALQEAATARATAVANATSARAAADTAKAAALAAANALAAVTAVQDSAVKAAAAAHAARLVAEKEAASAAREADRLEAEAATAAAEAKARAADAEAAAARAQVQAAGDKPKPVPVPRQRQKPLSLVPDALAGDAPMALTPP